MGSSPRQHHQLARAHGLRLFDQVQALKVGHRPILVTGSIRSGTTWVSRVLGTAPGIALIDEPFNRDHPPGLFAHRWQHQYTYVTDEGPDAEEILSAITDTLAFRYRPLHHLRSYESPRRTLGLLRDLPRQWFRRRLSHPRPLVKDPIAVFSAEWLACHFDMDVVILVRHPAAFAWSYLRTGEPNRFADLLAQPALIEGPLASHAEDVARAAREGDPILEAATLWRVISSMVLEYSKHNPHWIIRRHEDLSLDPFGRFPDLFRHVGLPFTAGSRRYLEKTTSPDNPVEAPTGVLHHLRRHSIRNVSVWRWRLSEGDVARVRLLTDDVAALLYPAWSWDRDLSPSRWSAPSPPQLDYGRTSPDG